MHGHNVTLRRVDDDLDLVRELLQGIGLFSVIRIAVIDTLNAGNSMTEQALGDVGTLPSPRH